MEPERRIIVDTATLAVWLGRDPAHVRRLVQRGLIEPVGRERRRGSGGRPTMLFDLLQVRERLHGTPYSPEQGASGPVRD